jgi:molybdopterin/thiamine biosynthesis adenylyltransferase
VRAGNGVRIVRAKVSVNGGDQLDELLEYADAAKVGPRPARNEYDQTFSRVVDAYDLDLMHGARLVVVGTGGAAAFLEDAARAGIEQFVLIDPDVVTPSNIATQQAYRRDIGRKKVDCIAERLRDIKPRVIVRTFAAVIDDLTDNEIAALCSARLSGRESKRSVLCGFTDAFAAQARVNLLGLQLGVPTVCAQVYLEGRGAEVTFTYPGVTPACHRCVLSSRYLFFLDQQKSNPVTSHGTPIFATGRLNAIKGFIVLALLHHGSTHPRWGGLLARIANRNLVQIRLDPDIQTTVGLKIFDRVFTGADQDRLLFDEAVWLPQNPESPRYGYPACPDCGGVGDLDSLIGTIGDTQRRLTEMQRGTDAEVRHEAIH